MVPVKVQTFTAVQTIKEAVPDLDPTLLLYKALQF